MKKLISAYTEQVLEFDNREEYNAYLTRLRTQRPQLYKIIEVAESLDGTIQLTIWKQYNNTPFPRNKEG